MSTAPSLNHYFVINCQFAPNSTIPVITRDTDQWPPIAIQPFNSRRPAFFDRIFLFRISSLFQRLVLECRLLVCDAAMTDSWVDLRWHWLTSVMDNCIKYWSISNPRVVWRKCVTLRASHRRPSQLCRDLHKTLSEFSLGACVSSQFRRVTDRVTDGRTDGFTFTKTALHSMKHGKQGEWLARSPAQGQDRLTESSWTSHTTHNRHLGYILSRQSSTAAVTTTRKYTSKSHKLTLKQTDPN